MSAEAETELCDKQDDDKVSAEHRTQVCSACPCILVWYRSTSILQVQNNAGCWTGQKVLEEIMKYGLLTANEIAKLTNWMLANVLSMAKFGCRTIANTLCHLSGVTNASVVRLRTTKINTIQRFVLRVTARKTYTYM